MIWFLIGFFVCYFLSACASVANDKESIKNGLVKLNGKYFRIKPLEKDNDESGWTF